MYKILCDGFILYDPLLPDFPISTGKFEPAVNKAGKLEITIPKKSKGYGLAKLYKSTVELYEDGELIFSGRPYAPSRDLFSNNTIIVAGELSYLNDSVFDPFDYYGPVSEFFTQLINNHNSQVEQNRQFKIGVCDVVNDTEQGNIKRSSEEPLNTWEIIEKRLINELGGYLTIRHETDGVYIDYLKNPATVSGQKIEQCINLIDVKEEIKTDSLATIVYPLGAKLKNDSGEETNKRLTIESVNNGQKFIVDEESKSLYGVVIKVMKHDDITEPINLKKAGERDLLGVKTNSHLKISAVDLSKAGYNINSFRTGQKVKIKIQSLGIEEETVIDKLTIDLLSPESSKIEIGKDKVLTDYVSEMGNRADQAIITSNAAASKSETANNKADGALNEIKETETRLESSIDQTVKSLETTISESVYSKGDTDKLISQKLTEFSQTADSFEMVFNRYDQTIEGHDTVINDVTKSIKFENGEIIVGNSESSTSTRVTNEQFNVELKGEITTYFDIEGTHSRNVDVENQVKHFGQWATRKGAKKSHGNNLNIVWIG